METARDSQLTATVTPTVFCSRTAAVTHPQTAPRQVMSNQPLESLGVNAWSYTAPWTLTATLFKETVWHIILAAMLGVNYYSSPCPAATQHCNFFKDGHPCNHCSIMLLRDEEETYTCLAVYRYMVDEQIFSSIRSPFLTPEPRQHSSAAKVQGLSAMHLYTGWVTGLWSALSSTILVCCLGL